MTKANIFVGLSGGGRTLENLISVMPQNDYRICGVFSNKPNCRGVSIAKENKIPVYILDYTQGQEKITKDINDYTKASKAEWVVLAGFLKLLPNIESMNKRIINIHPSLLPRHGGKGMYGMKVHESVINSGDTTSGATVHYVNDKYDDGDIISQTVMEVSTSWSANELAQKVFEAECKLYPKTIHQLINGTL